MVIRVDMVVIFTVGLILLITLLAIVGLAEVGRRLGNVLLLFDVVLVQQGNKQTNKQVKLHMTVYTEAEDTQLGKAYRMMSCCTYCILQCTVLKPIPIE